MQNELNKLYSLFMERNLKREDFEGLVYEYFVKNQEKTGLGHWKRDEYEDYLSWFYPRLRKAINVYREAGSSFETFILTVIRTTSKEYRLRLITKSVTEYSAWSVLVPELYAHEETPAYYMEKKEKSKTEMNMVNIAGRKNPKQILMLVLKCYYYLSDDFIDRVACHTGIDRKQLKEMVEKLRAKRQEKEDHLYFMKERIYSQYYRCIVYEKRLEYLPENSIPYLKLKRQLEKAKKRLECMKNRLNGTRTDATNREVAEIIGISKGSVDASLYNLKSKMKDYSRKANLN